MNLPSGPSFVLTRQHRLRLGAVLVVLGLLFQAQSFLAPGLTRLLSFAIAGVPLVGLGVIVSALALLRQPPPAGGVEATQKPEPPPPAAGPT